MVSLGSEALAVLPGPTPGAPDPHCTLALCLPSDPRHLRAVLAMLVSSAADGFGLASLTV